MKYTDNVLNVLTAKTFKGVGDVWINKNLCAELPYEAIVELLQNEKKVKENVSENIFLTIRENIRKKIETLENYCDGVVAIGDSKFPKYRGEVKEADRPNVLFYRGDLNLLSEDHTNIAVIGVLNPDKETEVDERKIVNYLVKKEAVIVSGLALGCDTIAHDQAIKSEGVTVAILPTPLNKIFPSQNQQLAEDIVDTGGLLITEYYDEPASSKEMSSRFIKRDRLQALFSDAVLLSASYSPDSIDPQSTKIDSGSRHAMEKAKDYGILRGVIYQDKYTTNPKYDLNRQIISSDNSTIIIDPDNMGKNIDNLLCISKDNNLFDCDFLQEESNKRNSPIFLLNVDNNKLSITRDTKTISLLFNKDIINAICELLNYYLNNKLVEFSIHNNVGFIKCFNDKEKQDYLMAIKIYDIKNNEDKDSFFEFFSLTF